jgi:hypothetical protein
MGSETWTLDDLLEHEDFMEAAALDAVRVLRGDSHLWAHSLRFLRPRRRAAIGQSVAEVVLELAVQTMEAGMIKLRTPPEFRVEEFEDHMVHDRGLSWRTIVNYTIDLKQFFRYLEATGIEHVDQIHRKTIRRVPRPRSRLFLTRSSCKRRSRLAARVTDRRFPIA